MEIESVALDKVTFAYPGRSPVFEDLDLDLSQDGLFWLRGEAGQGKSSLLKLLAGLLQPQAGHYWINSIDVFQLSFDEFLPYRLQIGYSFDSGGLLSNRTLRENLLLPLIFHHRCTHAEAEDRVADWLRRFGLETVKDFRPFAVTGGQRKLTVMLRALIHFPKLVLLDDPMAGLQEEARKTLAGLLEECMRQHGLRWIVYGAEKEMIVGARRSRGVTFPKKTNEAAA